MNPKEHIKIQIALVQIAKMASTIDVDTFLANISRAEAVSPIVDPTMYRKAMGNLEAIKRLARAVKEVKAAHEELMKVVMETAAQEEVPGAGV